jgi:RNA polymerase sigma-B factor
VSRFSFPARAEAAVEARRALASVGRLNPVRLAEAQVMVSELIANAVRHGGLDEGAEISMTVEHDPAVVTVRIGHPSAGHVDTQTRGMGLTLVESLSSRWDTTTAQDRFEVWFEVRAAGTGAALADLTDEEILARAMEDDRYREEAFARFSGLASGIARRFRGKGVGDADLEQVALMGLLNAMSRYDAEEGSFRPFATATIQGELKRQLRDRAWSVRVPRGLQERSLLVSKTSEILAQKLGRAPAPSDIGAELGLSDEEVIEGIAANSAYRWESIDAPDEQTGATLAESIHAADWALQSQEWEALAEGVRALPARDRELLYLRFYRDMTQTEIAAEMGISQMHVSRLLAKAIERLRDLVE